jgi:hypothetical protein
MLYRRCTSVLWVTSIGCGGIREKLAAMVSGTTFGDENGFPVAAACRGLFSGTATRAGRGHIHAFFSAVLLGFFYSLFRLWVTGRMVCRRCCRSVVVLRCRQATIYPCRLLLTSFARKIAARCPSFLPVASGIRATWRATCLLYYFAAALGTACPRYACLACYALPATTICLSYGRWPALPAQKRPADNEKHVQHAVWRQHADCELSDRYYLPAVLVERRRWRRCFCAQKNILPTHSTLPTHFSLQ